jgi:hypothetical protein
MVPILKMAGLASRPVWKSEEYLAATRVRTLDISANANYAIPALFFHRNLDLLTHIISFH